MKQYILIVGLLLCAPVFASAQTLDEWFNQKSTQKKYLAEQIAALKVYTGYMQKGYNIAKDGLQTINRIKDGDLGLHTGYFNSLKTVSPAVKRYARARDILVLQEGILNTVRNTRRQMPGTGVFSNDELAYINRVYDRLLKDCDGTISDLERVTTSGELEMKDDERIKRIEQSYDTTLRQQTFAQQFSAEVMALANGRLQDNRQIINSRVQYGIK